jgi:hypothetical protein
LVKLYSCPGFLDDERPLSNCIRENRVISQDESKDGLITRRLMDITVQVVGRCGVVRLLGRVAEPGFQAAVFLFDGLRAALRIGLELLRIRTGWHKPE